MNENANRKTTKYFAASNSYKGFVSFFDNVFPSDGFDRIYILKGGPGTGKSSFMKKVASTLRDKDCNIDEICCSSDPHSLDGIIAEKNDRRIAILDGTAPHERDAIIPGAIDEIINLGCSWDSRWLSARREQILDLVKEKSLAYKCGYSYLKIAGASDDFIRNIYESIFDKNKAKSVAEEILSNVISSDKQEIKSRLISSFGKYGYYKINESEYNLEHKIGVRGDEYSASLFLRTLYEVALSKKMSFINYMCPLNTLYSEGITFYNAQMTVMRSDVGEIDSLVLLTDDRMYSERTKGAKEFRRESLEEARRWFSIASELHFELEKIYGESMNFEKNDEIFDIKLREIKNILQI